MNVVELIGRPRRTDVLAPSSGSAARPQRVAMCSQKCPDASVPPTDVRAATAYEGIRHEDRGLRPVPPGGDRGDGDPVPRRGTQQRLAAVEGGDRPRVLLPRR